MLRHAELRSVSPARAFRDDMVFLSGGRFRMGSDRHYPEEAPAHEVTVAPFFIDLFPVTNRQFSRFVTETGYVTVAEGRIEQARNELEPTAQLLPGAFVFTASNIPIARDRERWWFYMPGACWRRPENGPSVFEERSDHPVTCVAFEDCEAYASWAGKSLPTEAQWEYAARGGLDDAEFAWGEELTPKGRRMANTWSGDTFPCDPQRPFPAYRTTQVDAFPPNGYGLYDMIGNVWEWTSDRFGLHIGAVRSFDEPLPEETFDVADELCMVAQVVKGGSFLCAPDYSARYRPAARQSLLTDTAGADVGFRCVSTVEQQDRPRRRPEHGSS